MKKNYLIVVDMQKDFVDGALGTSEAVSIVPAVLARVKQDTHTAGYLETQEGKNLPVRHCIRGTEGWAIIPELRPYAETVFDKPTFGSRKLGEFLASQEDICQVTVIGLCTDICVISNALMIKAFLPEVPIVVQEKCCAGVTPESHETALAAMKSCQIHVN